MEKSKEEVITPAETATYWSFKGSIAVWKHIGFNWLGDYVLEIVPTAEHRTTVRKELINHECELRQDFDPTKLEMIDCDGAKAYKQQREYLACSHCGSAMFEQFLEAINGVNDLKAGYSIERASGKNYKFYFGVPGNQQIKFYTNHIPKEIIQDEKKLAEFNEKLISAQTKSWADFQARMNQSRKLGDE